MSYFDEIAHSPCLAIGAGVAGLSAALAHGRATVITKSAFGTGGSTAEAQGGIAAALAGDDSPALHGADTLAVGGGIADPGMVEVLVEEGPTAVLHLIDAGARFDRADDQSLLFGREAGHQRRRILHASGDATGAEVMRALTAATLAHPDIEIVEHSLVVDLVQSAGRIVGVTTVEPGGWRVLRLSPAVVLATGGVGRAYLHTTNPLEVTGDGIAMAARAGARLADLEFVQFHPTALATDADPMPLLTEALRGEGAVLVDDSGARFMVEEHPDAELAPRDVVARAIWRQLNAGRKVYLDATEAIGDSFSTRFPTVYAFAVANGLLPTIDPLPVSPAAHYFMGGIAIDSNGRSSRPGLWAVGEASSGGIHGANRLASNSLLDGLVFGARTARSVLDAGGRVDRLRHVQLPAGFDITLDPGATGGTELRRILWEQVGLVRDEANLRTALADIAGLDPATVEDRNLLITGRLITEAALLRRESRGAHYRSDYPDADPALAHRSFVDPTPVRVVSVPVR